MTEDKRNESNTDERKGGGARVWLCSEGPVSSWTVQFYRITNVFTFLIEWMKEAELLLLRMNTWTSSGREGGRSAGQRSIFRTSWQSLRCVIHQVCPPCRVKCSRNLSSLSRVEQVCGGDVNASPRLPACRLPPPHPGPRSGGTPLTAGTARRAGGPGGRRPSGSSASQTACWPLTEELRPVGRPSLEFFLKRRQKESKLFHRKTEVSSTRKPKSKLHLILTKGGEGGGGAEAPPGKIVGLRGWRLVGNEHVVMVICCQGDGESGHPGRVAVLREDTVCRRTQTDVYDWDLKSSDGSPQNFCGFRTRLG